MLELKAQKRDILGKKVKSLRKKGFLPAVLYGEKVASLSVTVPFRDFEKVYLKTGESTLIKLDVEGTPHTVLIFRIAQDPLRGVPIHADFYAVRMDKEIRTKVPVKIVGESLAVKNEGGILLTVLRELEIEALPQNLPHEIKVDISGLLTLESRIQVKDIVFPAGVKVLVDPNDAVVIVETPRTEEELVALEQASEAAPAEVKTEQEAKAEAKAETKTETEVEAKTEVSKDGVAKKEGGKKSSSR